MTDITHADLEEENPAVDAAVDELISLEDERFKSSLSTWEHGQGLHRQMFIRKGQAKKALARRKYR